MCILLLHLNFATTIVLLIRNNKLNIGFSNGSIGIIRDIVYNKNVSLLALSMFILVDFSNKYKGKTYFLNNNSQKG